MIRRFRVLTLIGAMALLLAATASAQSTYGLIEGRIVDATGAALPGVTVTVVQPKNGFTRVVVTNEQGLYRAFNLNPGEYNVTAELSGFGKAVRQGVKIDVGQAVGLNLALDLEQMSVAVEVAAQAPIVNAVSPEISNTIDTRRVNELPLNGRDFTRLALLAPGVVQTASLVASIAVNATSVSQNNYLLDGVDATRIDDAYPSNGFERGSRIQTASVESVEEFRVLTTNYSAEYGRAAGAVISAITKSGTNSFRGSAYSFFRNQKFDARNFFDVGEKPPFDMKQFGGSLGGPIRKDRLFFFNSYEGSRKQLGATATGTVPTTAFRARVPAVLQPILASVPLPNVAGGTNPDVGTVSYADTTRVNENVYSLRVDAKLSEKDSLFSRYNIQDSLVDGPQYVVFGSALSGQLQSVPVRTQSFTTSYVRIFRPNVVNEAKVGMNRFNAVLGQKDPNSPTVIPQTTITGVSVVPGISGQSSQTNTSLELIDNLSWYAGSHTMKAGFNVRRVHHDYEQESTTTLTYPSMAAFLLNQPSQAAFTPAIPRTSIQGWNYSGYFQDDIKASARLTLNAGLRYDYTPPYTDPDGRMRNFDASTMLLMDPGSQLYNPDRNNFGPRTGFTYDLFGTGKSVLRGGYGIYFALYTPVGGELLLTANAPGATLLTRTQQADLAYPVVQFTNGTVNAPTRRSLDPNRQDTYNHQATINLSQQLGPDAVTTIGYVGNWARANERSRPINLIDPATGRRPFAQYSQILVVESSGRANYNALQAAFNYRVKSGLSFNANYTYAQLMDDIVSPQNPFASWDLEYAHGTREVPHNLSVNGLYELPYGDGKRWGNGGGVLPALFGGWQVNGVVLARSGLPYSVTLGAVTRSGTGWTTNQRPDVVPGVDHVGTINGPAGYLNPAAFANPANGTFGNLPRNTERGPRFVQVDVSFFKNVQFAGTQKIQLRLEIFNVINRVQFPSAPTANFLAPATFGQYFSTFGRTEGFGTSRQAQLAIRYTF